MTICATAWTFKVLGVEHSTEAWQIFIDSSKASLKAVLLHNGNMYASVPVGYSTHLKETYETMSLLFEKIRYRDYNWSIWGDLKVITDLMEMQIGNTKYCCFICEWGSRDRKHHYTKKIWLSKIKCSQVVKITLVCHWLSVKKLLCLHFV